MSTSTNHSLASNAALLKSKASKYAYYGVVIALVAIVIATALVSVYNTGGISLDALIEAQDSAVEAGIGVWDPGACGARGPRPAVELDLTSPNPAGPDDDVLDQEYVTIINEEPEPLDLSGWTLRDESTANRLVFPPGSVIEAGRSVRVVTGCTGGPDVFAWCAERSIWSNGGDSGYLLDDAGRIVATDRYRP